MGLWLGCSAGGEGDANTPLPNSVQRWGRIAEPLLRQPHLPAESPLPLTGQARRTPPLSRSRVTRSTAQARSRHQPLSHQPRPWGHSQALPLCMAGDGGRRPSSLSTTSFAHGQLCRSWAQARKPATRLTPSLPPSGSSPLPSAGP